MRYSNKTPKVSLVLVVLVVLVTVGIDCRKETETQSEPDVCALTGLSPEVRQIIEQKTNLLVTFAREPVLIHAVREANRKNQALSLEDILRLDEVWQRTEGIDDSIKSFVTNPCAQLLIDFQETHNGFSEIFVTDEKGLIVAETNKTSDYYQADEQWWVDAYQDGLGRCCHGKIEYDKSAHVEAIPIFLPIIDPDSHKAIGVLKAVCDITAVKMEL